MEYDYQFKLVMIGDAAVGKSCLLNFFVEGKFRKNSSYTVGVEFGSKTIQVSGKSVKLQIWDTAGQERYRAVTRSYYRGAVGAIVVYDIASKESFDHVTNWVNDARTLARSDTSIILVGNKSDLKDKREVSFMEASRFAQENDVMFIEASALTGEGVEDVFTKLAKVVLNRVEDGAVDVNAVTSGTSLTASSNRGSSSSIGLGDKASSCAC